MSTRLRSLCLAAATAATTVTAVAAVTGTAAAAVTTTCKPVANIFTMQADGDLWLYKHADPANGGASWGGAQQVGWGWGGKTFAGADGRLYNITTGGELRRLRYNGSGWDTFPNGGQYEAIGWGWQRYVEPGNRGKITVDTNGSIYTLEGDQLRWWHYREDVRAWADGSGKVLDEGWSRFNSITASGAGGLQARDGSGTLHRFRHQGFHEVFQAYDVLPATRWPGYDKFFSPGGDVYYAVRPDTGQLLWNHFNEEDTTSNWRTASGSVIGWDWGTDVDITATTTDCQVTNLPGGPLGVRDDRSHGTAVITTTSGGTHLVNQASDHWLTDTHSTGSGWTSRRFGQRYSGVSRPVTVDADGSATVAATNHSWGDVELHTLRGAQWEVQNLKGGMAWTPALTRRVNGTLSLYAAADTNDEGTRGHVYVREQQPGGAFTSWRPFGSRSTVYTGKPVAISRGSETIIVAQVYQNGVWKREWFRHTAGSLPVSMGAFPDSAGSVALSRDGLGGVLAFGSINVSGVEKPAVLREKADRSGFEENWQVVDNGLGAERANGGVDALQLPNGAVALSMAGEGNKVFVTTSVAAGSTQFHPWQQVATEGSILYPTSLALTPTGGVALAARSDADGSGQYLWTAQVPAETATQLQFTGGKVG